MRWRGGLMAMVLVAGAATALAQAQNATRGRHLFDGEATIPARIVGQDFELPGQASRCVNCHGPLTARAAAPAAAALPIALALAPALTAAALTESWRRRGGPPSRYDAASLCTLLRTGVDPAHVIILRTMPRYQINDADCQSMWLHLTATPSRR